MPLPLSDYFHYLPASPELSHWGVGVTAVGAARIAPAAPYPPATHPSDHYFAWSRGRRLDAYQIVLITAGRGFFETRETGKCEVEAGSAFMLFPKVWHRYRPDPVLGWEEKWTEFRGPVADDLLRAGVLEATSPIRKTALAAGLETIVGGIHARVRHAQQPGFDPELSARMLSALAIWQSCGRATPARSRLVRAVAEAEKHLADNLSEPVNIEELARKLGVAYSHFRRAFKLHTGSAPWQYVLHQRLDRARRLLSAGENTLEDIAARLGFSSAFHLSAAFKQAFGVAPDKWRRQFATQPAAPAQRKRSRTSRM
ncbi:MAG: AraC family transcriptional regulator [Nibricoccus sp.]